jgi:CRP-like cAMP-binding protein
MSNETPDGRSITLSGVPPGGWFGEGTVLKQENYRYNIQALRPSVVAGIPVETFHWLLDQSISFNRFVMNQLNERLALILEAEKDLKGLQKTKTMQGHTGEVFPGIITGIQSYGFFVRLESLRVEGLVHVSSLKDDWYEYRSRQQTLIGRKNRRQYRLGDTVEVEVKDVDYYRQQIDLAVVGGGCELTAEELEVSDQEVPENRDVTEIYELEDELEEELEEELDEDELEDGGFNGSMYQTTSWTSVQFVKMDS